MWQLENVERIKREPHNNRMHRTECYRKYRATVEGKEKILAAIKRYEAKNPEKKKAWNKVIYKRHLPCIICGKMPTHGHHSDYTKPLKVVYLCPLHHKQVHRKVV